MRIDRILSESKLDDVFLQVAMRDQGLDPSKRTAKQNARFARMSALCRRANVALLQWLLHLGEVDSVKVFAKSTSHRFESWVKPESMQASNHQLIARCAAPVPPEQSAPFGLQDPMRCDEAFLDTTVVKAPIHFPTDWGCCAMPHETALSVGQARVIAARISNLVEPCIERIKAKALPIKKLWSDRSMFSRKNEQYLQAQNIRSGFCPRDPAELARRLQDPEVQAGMKRRSGTEARVAIFKNAFLGNPVAGRSFAARERTCGWAVLTHNLWVLARLPQAKSEEPKQAKPRKLPPRVERAAA